MISTIVQLAIIGIWSVMLGTHTRRLLRLAHAPSLQPIARPLRYRLGRVWWWLGREEFWRKVQSDCMYCVEVTLLLFLFAWGVHF